MFEKSAAYYDKFYSFLDYKAAVDRVREIIVANHKNAETLLDVACGTGRHVEFLSKYYEVSGLDILEDLLVIARQRCCEVSFYQGDMTSFELDRKFDVLTCLFCSIGYTLSLEKMQMAIKCMSAHLNPGGLLIIEPWIAPEQCWTDRVTCDVIEEENFKLVRMYSHERSANTSVYEIHTLVGTPQDGVTHFVETERMGLFTAQEYSSAFVDAGLDVFLMDVELFPGHKYGVFVGRKL